MERKSETQLPFFERMPGFSLRMRRTGVAQDFCPCSRSKTAAITSLTCTGRNSTLQTTSLEERVGDVVGDAIRTEGTRRMSRRNAGGGAAAAAASSTITEGISPAAMARPASSAVSIPRAFTPRSRSSARTAARSLHSSAMTNTIGIPSWKCSISASGALSRN